MTLARLPKVIWSSPPTCELTVHTHKTQGSKAERTKPARVAAISKAMADMPRLVAAHRAERGRAADEHKLEKLFKKKKWI